MGMIPAQLGCHVNTSRDTSVVLVYSVNNGVTWNRLKVHRDVGKASRVLVRLDDEVRSRD